MRVIVPVWAMEQEQVDAGFDRELHGVWPEEEAQVNDPTLTSCDDEPWNTVAPSALPAPAEGHPMTVGGARNVTLVSALCDIGRVDGPVRGRR